MHAPRLPMGYYLKMFDSIVQPFMLQTQHETEHHSAKSKNNQSQKQNFETKEESIMYKTASNTTENKQYKLHMDESQRTKAYY